MASNVNEHALEIGKTYFSLMYADENLSIPQIETLVYLGRTKVDNEGASRSVHLFQYAASYLADGNWKKMSSDQKAQFDTAPVIFFELGLVDPVCDGDGLLEQLQEWRTRAK